MAAYFSNDCVALPGVAKFFKVGRELRFNLRLEDCKLCAPSGPLGSPPCFPPLLAPPNNPPPQANAARAKTDTLQFIDYQNM